MENLNIWGIAGVGALMGIVAGFWQYVKSFIWKIVNFFVQRVEIPTEAGHEALVSYLISHHKRARIYEPMYGAAYEYQRDGRYGLVPYELFGNRTLIFWNGWFPFLFSNQAEQRTTNANGQATQSEAMKVFSTVTYIKGTLNMDELMRKSCAVRNTQSWNTASAEEQIKNRFCIHHVPKRESDEQDHGWGSNSSGLAWYHQGQYRLLSHTPDQLGKASISNGHALDNLIFPQRVKELIKEIDLWRKSKDWYREKGIPWKRGWMLYGPPGTGKTALARAFAEDMNMPIYVFNLAEMSNVELIRTWNEMQVNVPCIALIEDIDNVFHGRENVSRKNSGLFSMMIGGKKKDDDNGNDRPSISTPLTFDCLLNCLDGVERADGIFTIVTTNDISKIDPALGQPRKLPDGTLEFISTRPGRIDKAVELSYMEAPDKKRMAHRILGAYEVELQQMLAFVDQYPDLQETPAQFQERCGQIALKCFWRELEAKEARDLEFQAAVTTKPDSTDSTPCEINGWPADETLIEDLVLTK